MEAVLVDSAVAAEEDLEAAVRQENGKNKISDCEMARNRLEKARSV